MTRSSLTISFQCLTSVQVESLNLLFKNILALQNISNEPNTPQKLKTAAEETLWLLVEKDKRLNDQMKNNTRPGIYAFYSFSIENKKYISTYYYILTSNN